MLHRRLLSFGALIILPLAALLFYGAYQQRREALREARAGVVRSTHAVAERHRLSIERAEQLLAVLARLPKIREEDWNATNEILKDVVQHFPDYLNLRVSDFDGAMLATALPNAPASSNAGRDWFEEVIRTSSFAMSGYFVGETTGKSEVVIGYPVLDRRDRVRHVLSVTIDLRAFNTDSATLPQNSIVMVLDRSGTILARDPDPQPWMGRPLTSVAVMDALRSGRSEGVMESDGLDGTPRLIGYIALPVARGAPGVYLAIGTDRERVLAPINRALLINAGGLVLVTVLMLGAIVIGGRHLVLAPVDRLLQVTRRIGAGDLDARADDRLSRDAGELGELARALNDMATHLRDRSAERVRSEQALRASESQYRRIVEMAIEGIWTIDAEGRTTFVNQPMAEMLGYSPDEMLGISFLDFMDVPARAEATGALARREAGESARFDFRFRHKSGRDVCTRLSTGPIVDEAGRFAGALAMATDITESRAAAEALGAVERRLRVVLDNVTDGFFTMDREWRYTDINPAGARMLGKTVEDLVGRRSLDAFPEAAGTVWEMAYRRVMKTGEPMTVDGYYEPLDTWFEASVFPFAGGISVFFRDITVRKRAERAVQDSEARLAKIVETIPVGLAISRASDGEILFANERLREMLSPSRSLVGRRTVDFFDDPSVRQQLVGEIAVTGRLKDRVMALRVDAGERRVFSLSAVAIEQSGEPALLSALVDVTERERASLELRRGREALQKAQQIAHLGNWEWDVPTGALAWSDEVYRICGREPQSFTPTYDAFLGTIHPDDRQTVVDAVDTALAGRGAYSVEHRILRPDGVERVVHEQAEVSRDEREQPTRMIGTVLDITERHRAEEALRQTETQLRRLLDSSPVAIYSLAAGPSPRTTFVSENVTSVLGYEAHELVNDASLWKARLHPDDVHRTLPELGRVLEHGVASLQYRFRHKDGHYVWVRDESKLIRDVDGGPVEIVGVLEDVTSKVELDEQLRQAQKMEAVGRLAGGIAHDFNNLLQVIGGHAELLLAMPDANAAVHARARTIRTAADRGATLARQLLAYSRRQVLQPRVVDVNRLVADVKAMMDPVVGAGLSIEILLAPDLAAVSIDHDQFEQVLMNLLVNARDAMPGGGVITVATAMVELADDNGYRPFDVPAGRYVAISVRDGGAGIDDETLSHLFEPFFTTKPVGKGAGLGLASVYGILTQSGGYIAVLSEGGRGATFTILLPPV